MGMDAYFRVYVGAVVELGDFFTMHEEPADCACKGRNPRRKYCSECGAQLGLKDQLWTPKAPELFGLEGEAPLDEDGWDEYILNGEFHAYRKVGDYGIHGVSSGDYSDEVFILGVQLANRSLCLRGGVPSPYRVDLAQLAEVFEKVKKLLEKHSMGDRTIEQWVSSYISC